MLACCVCGPSETVEVRTLTIHLLSSGIDALEEKIYDKAKAMVKTDGEEGIQVKVLEERVPHAFLKLIDKIQALRAELQEHGNPPIMTEHQLKAEIKAVIRDDPYDTEHPNDFSEATLFLQERGRGHFSNDLASAQKRYQNF